MLPYFRRLNDSDTEFTWSTDIDCMGNTTCFSRCYQRPPTVNNLVESCNFSASLYIRCCKYIRRLCLVCIFVRTNPFGY